MTKIVNQSIENKKIPVGLATARIILLNKVYPKVPLVTEIRTIAVQPFSIKILEAIIIDDIKDYCKSIWGI